MIKPSAWLRPGEKVHRVGDHLVISLPDESAVLYRAGKRCTRRKYQCVLPDDPDVWYTNKWRAAEHAAPPTVYHHG